MQSITLNAKHLCIQTSNGMFSPRRYVLTVANCFDGPTVNPIAEVRLGVTDLNNERGNERHQIIKISEADVIVHENWRGNEDTDSIVRDGYDIALIRLPEKAITVDDDSDYLIRPACLPFEEIMEIGYVFLNHEFHIN